MERVTKNIVRRERTEASTALLDEIDEQVEATQRQTDKLLLDAVRTEEVQKVSPSSSYGPTGARAWTLGGRVD